MSGSRLSLGNMSLFSRVDKFRFVKKRNGAFFSSFDDRQQIEERFRSLRKKLNLMDCGNPFFSSYSYRRSLQWAEYMPTTRNRLSALIIKTTLNGFKHSKTDDQIIADLNKLKGFPEYVVTLRNAEIQWRRDRDEASDSDDETASIDREEPPVFLKFM